MSDRNFSGAELIADSPDFASTSPPVRLAVFGDPVAHSKSPVFHNAALRAAGIDATYARIHVTPDELGEALAALKTADFIGTNLTIPHKAAALKFLDDVDETARLIGAVNTVVVRDGRLGGYNTDAPGFVRAIREEFQNDVRDLRIMVFGAGGGAGRAIAVQCALEGCERLVLVNRSFEKVESLASELARYFRGDRLVGPVERLSAIPHELDVIRRELEHVDLIVNATSLGMRRTDPALIPQAFISPSLLVYDTVYSGGKSRLLEDAAAMGARSANGLSLLLHQGALSFEIWFDREAPLKVMRDALRKA